MLPTIVSEYLPHTGLVLIMLGLIFSIVATTDAPKKGNSGSGDIFAESKFTILAYSLIFAGGFLLLGPISAK